MSLAKAIAEHEACPSCSTEGAIVWHRGEIDCHDQPAAVSRTQERWVKPRQSRGTTEASEPPFDTITQGEIVRRDLASGEGTVEYRQWLASHVA